MPAIEKLRRVFVLCTAVGLLAAAGSPAVWGQEPLQWKFTKGAKYNYAMSNEMSIASTAGLGGAQNLTMNQDLNMTWDIQEVTAEGNAIVQLQIDNVKMKMQLPAPFGAIEYDSTSEKPPTGAAASLVPMFTAMTKSPYTLTMSPRGEITDVKVPEAVVAALKSSPDAQALGEIASPEGFKRLMQQGLPDFPEDAAKHEKEWTKAVEVKTPEGKQIVETTYRFKGKKEVEGKQVAEFQPTINLKFEATKVKIVEQKSDGQVLFDVADGWLESSKHEQHVTIEQEGGIQTKIDQKIAVTFKPAGEGSGEKGAESEAKK